MTDVPELLCMTMESVYAKLYSKRDQRSHNMLEAGKKRQIIQKYSTCFDIEIICNYPIAVRLFITFIIMHVATSSSTASTDITDVYSVFLLRKIINSTIRKFTFHALHWRKAHTHTAMPCTALAQNICIRSLFGDGRRSSVAIDLIERVINALLSRHASHVTLACHRKREMYTFGTPNDRRELDSRALAIRRQFWNLLHWPE